MNGEPSGKLALDRSSFRGSRSQEELDCEETSVPLANLWKRLSVKSEIKKFVSLAGEV